MIDAVFNQPGYVATKRMLDATALRHEAIASNIANIETPNYKRIDVASNFQAELRQALSSKNPNAIAALQPSLEHDTTAVTFRQDGNNVQLESELLSMNQNTFAHALETQLVSANLLKLRLAITGRPA